MKHTASAAAERRKQKKLEQQRRTRRFNGCLGKAKYPSKSSAEAIGGMAVYKCPDCGKWHLTGHDQAAPAMTGPHPTKWDGI